MPARTLLIANWLDLKHSDHRDQTVLQPIVSDASQRKYYRCCIDNKSYIVMDSLYDSSLPKFIAIARQFSAWGLNVPQIYKTNLQEGLVLLSDLGDDLYLPKLTASTANELYIPALQALLILQKNTACSTLSLQKMGTEYIKFQLTVFQQWFLQQHLNLTASTASQQMLRNLEQLFCRVFEQTPTVIVHLDYHSRNLLIGEPQPGILDFQDAMLGPVVYDLASLLQDAYIAWPTEQVEDWVLEYKALASKAGILPATSNAQFLKLFYLVGLQRHLKNLGVFARLHHRDGKSKYLENMPMLLSYIASTCNKYPELAELAEFFATQITPHPQLSLA